MAKKEKKERGGNQSLVRCRARYIEAMIVQTMSSGASRIDDREIEVDQKRSISGVCLIRVLRWVWLVPVRL